MVDTVVGEIRRDQSQHRQSQIKSQLSSQAKENDEEDWLFSCRCESAKLVSTLLSCLNSSSSTSNMIQPVTVFVSPTSITFHAYGSSTRQSQASVDLQSGLFSHYEVYTRNCARNVAASGSLINDDDIESKDPIQTAIESKDFCGEFCINLSTVLECLHSLGTQTLDKTKLSLSYNLRTEIFKLELLEETGVLSTAAIPGMLTPSLMNDASGNSAFSDSLALAFRSSHIVARILILSEGLREILPELEGVLGATICTIQFNANTLEFLTVGTMGDCVVTIPTNSPCVLSFSGSTTQNFPIRVSRSYPLPLLRRAMRGLDYAQETCITVNAEGMIAIQHQIVDTAGQGIPNFVDFIMACLLSENDEECNDANRSQETSCTPVSNASEASSSKSYVQVTTAKRSLKTKFGWEEDRSTVNDRSIVTNYRNIANSSQYAERTNNSDILTLPPIDKDSDNELNCDDSLPPFSRVVLFGNVAKSKNSESSTLVAPLSPHTIRSRRRLRRRSSLQQSYGHASTDNEASTVNHTLDDDASETSLDVTARATTPPRRQSTRCQQLHNHDEEGSSSPELVYQ
jgi:Repair protein Rad1/Rec1/Rad17